MPVRRISIKKVYQSASTSKAKWVAVRDHRAKPIPRGYDLEWKLFPDPRNKHNPIEAHFQFGHNDLVQNHPRRRNLTRDLTAFIRKPNGKLELKLRDLADRRRNPRRYAVWVRDETMPHGGVFAVGEDMNPPPEIDIGGGG